MPKHTLDDLRDHLFATMTALRDPEKPMEIYRAKAVSDLAQTIINTAKVEVEYHRLTGKKGRSAFIAAPLPDDAPAEKPELPAPQETAANPAPEPAIAPDAADKLPAPEATPPAPRDGVFRTVERQPGVTITRNRIT